MQKQNDLAFELGQEFADKHINNMDRRTVILFMGLLEFLWRVNEMLEGDQVAIFYKAVGEACEVALKINSPTTEQ